MTILIPDKIHFRAKKITTETLKNVKMEAEAGGSRGQGMETILVNMVKPRLY